ncbi:MAG TPA: carboxypeptidase regulatory-like domain-containing protein [Methanocella sp.]|nr:carboxypeptidase regulatory-like domain-containing protein [Methanocella sp.]
MRRVSILLAAVILFISAIPAAAYADGAVAVRVFYPDGAPAAGIHVSLQNGSYVSLVNGTTDASGTCVFTVTPGSKAIRALIGGPYNVTSIWHDATDAAIEVRLPSTNVVTGTIKLDGLNGNPLVVLDDEGIFDSSPYGVSRQNGSSVQTFTVNRFSFTTTAGRHVLYAVGYSDGMVYRSDPLEVYVPGNQAPVVLELKYAGDNASMLPPAVYERLFHTSDGGSPVSIAGRLSGADGRPIANATLTAQDYFLKEHGSTTTGAGGAFSFGPMYPGADMVRFKAVIWDNGTEYISLSPFYQAQNTTGLDVGLPDYPRSTVGYVYGIIARSANRSNPVPISGTVYLSNGLVQAVSPGLNNGQFFFTLAPGSYDIYAEHLEGGLEGGERLVSEKKHIEVEAVWSPLEVNPTILVVEPEKVQYIPLIGALIVGSLSALGLACAMRRWL